MFIWFLVYFNKLFSKEKIFFVFWLVMFSILNIFLLICLDGRLSINILSIILMDFMGECRLCVIIEYNLLCFIIILCNFFVCFMMICLVVIRDIWWVIWIISFFLLKGLDIKLFVFILKFFIILVVVFKVVRNIIGICCVFGLVFNCLVILKLFILGIMIFNKIKLGWVLIVWDNVFFLLLVVIILNFLFVNNIFNNKILEIILFIIKIVYLEWFIIIFIFGVIGIYYLVRIFLK